MTQKLIIGLGGTTRSNSVTEKALQLALASAAGCGARTVLLGAADLALPMYTPDIATRSGAAQRLVQLLREAAGIIIAAPGYHGSVSGLVKNALDYVEDMRNDTAPYFEGRAVGCIVAAAGVQSGLTTLVALRSIVHTLGGWPTPLGAAIDTVEPVFDSSGRCVSGLLSEQLAGIGRQVMEFAANRAFHADFSSA